jgi:hypothetical protein
MKIVKELVWDYDQRFKIFKEWSTFQILDENNREWFITSLFPHIHFPLTQEKIVTQLEALKIVMKLEASHVGENNVGMAQFQSQLATSTIQLQKIMKGKENCEGFWCITCRAEGHHKYDYETFQQYLNTRALNPLEIW